MQLLVLPRQDFLEMLTGQDSAVLEWQERPRGSHGGDWDQANRVQALSRLNLFSHLDADALEDLARKSTLDRWPPGSTLIRQGDEGDRFFLMLEGRATASIDGSVVNQIMPGDQFGEIALLHQVRRTAHVVAAEPTVTLSLNRQDFVPALRERVLAG
jgi:CRP-like cAMP-binding protein